MKVKSFIDLKITGKTTTSRNMQTNKLAAFIQAAAQQQNQELHWISSLYQQRLKTLTETNKKYNEWIKSQCNEDTQAIRSETT